MTNNVHPSAYIAPNVQLGQYNTIGKDVVIGGFQGRNDGPIKLGDCNIIHDGVRILISNGARIGDWNVIHNSITIAGTSQFDMGHNCWLGQDGYYDCRDFLTIGNGARFGLQTCVWTHAAAAEQIEGGLYQRMPTIIEEDVWCVGARVSVNPGVVMGRRSVALAHSVVASATLPGRTYSGIPAKEIDVPFWTPVTLSDKFEMMRRWAEVFAEMRSHVVFGCGTMIELATTTDRVIIGDGPRMRSNASFFDLGTKTYTKTLSALEREFYGYIYGNKARFIPA